MVPQRKLPQQKKRFGVAWGAVGRSAGARHSAKGAEIAFTQRAAHCAAPGGWAGRGGLGGPGGGDEVEVAAAVGRDGDADEIRPRTPVVEKTKT